LALTSHCSKRVVRVADKGDVLLLQLPLKGFVDGRELFFTVVRVFERVKVARVVGSANDGLDRRRLLAQILPVHALEPRMRQQTVHALVARPQPILGPGDELLHEVQRLGRQRNVLGKLERLLPVHDLAIPGVHIMRQKK
jgi:hypothetical protein